VTCFDIPNSAFIGIHNNAFIIGISDHIIVTVGLTKNPLGIPSPAPLLITKLYQILRIFIFIKGLSMMDIHFPFLTFLIAATINSVVAVDSALIINNFNDDFVFATADCACHFPVTVTHTSSLMILDSGKHTTACFVIHDSVFTIA
jgi:hypothetical protein